MIEPKLFSFRKSVSHKRNHVDIGERLYRQVRSTPNSPAIEFGGQSMSYIELHCHAIFLSLRLIKCGITVGETIGVVTEAGFEQIVGQVAVVYAGGTISGVDPSLPETQMRYRLASARICLADGKHVGRWSDYKMIRIPTGSVTRKRLQAALRRRPRSVEPHHCSHLMHTSGTTGMPKAVQIPAKGLIQFTEEDLILLSPGERVAQMAMVGFDISLFEIWASLLRGATILPIPRSVVQDVFQLARKWVELNVTVAVMPASMIPMLIMANPQVFAAMNALYSGGEPPNMPALRSVFEEGPPKHIFNCYGPTETCIFSLLHEITPEDTVSGASPLTRVVGQTQIMVLDENHQPVPDGDAGELFIGGDGVSPGYLNVPEKNFGRFVTHKDYTALPTTCNFYATGDLVRRDSGNLYLLGRIDNQVKVRGYRIELDGVESAIMQTGLVSMVTACKVQKDEDPMSASLVAFVVPVGQGDLDLVRLAKLLKGQLAHFSIPRLVVCDNLPLNNRGKIDRPKLMADYLAKGSEQGSSEKGCQNDADEKTSTGRLCRLWRSILTSHTGPIKETDDFLSLGGTSLQAAILAVRVKKEFAVKVSASLVYENYSLRDMATYIERGGADFSINDAQNKAYRRDVDFYQTLRIKPQPTPPCDWSSPGEGRIFLTGATGFVGAFTLHSLLGQPEVTSVICLARGVGNMHARHRIMDMQSLYRLDSDPSIYEKLTVLVGCLEKPDFGLGTGVFEELAGSISAIFHLAAVVNYANTYTNHRGANVVGTGNMLRLQAAGRSKRLHYMSSLSTYGPTGLLHGTKKVYEDDHPIKFIDCVQYDNGYAQSKWVAEKLVVDAMEDGFPISVYRPGAVFCHSVTGVATPNDFTARLMASCIRTRCYPTIVYQSKHFVPVDYVVDSMIYLSKLQRSLGQQYNMVPEAHQQPADEMEKTFIMLGQAAQVSLEQVPYEVWVDRVRAQDDHDPLRPLLPMLEEKVYKGYSRWRMYERMPMLSTTNLKRDLQDAPQLLNWPTMDIPLVRKVLTSLKLI